jgi:catechol 2,3-dioxygenase-like lactoylglutathione lyase family enzyme
MIDFKRVDHVHIAVPPEKLEEARAFYAEVIGLSLDYRPDSVFPEPGYWFKIAGVQLHIGVEPKMPLSIRHTAFEIADVNAAREYLKSKNVEILEEPDIPGRIRFSFRDPFGNRFELLQYI